MAYTVLVHVRGEEAVMAEMDELPGKSDTLVYIKNPRRRDGKDLHFVLPEVNTVIWPMEGINFIEVIPTGTEEDVISFVRE